MSYDNFYIPVTVSKQLATNSLLRVFFHDRPVVLCRLSDGSVSAYEDVCPHRGAMLSKGRLVNDELECPYHGWRFDRHGTNSCVPVKNEAVACGLTKVFVREAYGLVWLAKNDRDIIPELRTGRPSLVFDGHINAKPENALENFLEGSHTHFVHDGIVRSRAKVRQKIAARLIPNERGFEVHYEQEPAKGMMTRLLPAKYRNLKAVSTYIHPHIAVLEYFGSGKLVALVETIIAPREKGIDYFARVYLYVGLLSPLAPLLARRFFSKIIKQDKEILEQQEENSGWVAPGGYYSDETDVVGREIFSWLHKRDRVSVSPVEFTVYW